MMAPPSKQGFDDLAAGIVQQTLYGVLGKP